MNNENTLPAVQQQHAMVPHSDPFSRMMGQHHSINAGAVAIEQERAIAEAQGQLTLAKKFPRSMTAAMTEFLDACNNTEFAKTAFYAVKNRGSGPSIRMAEEAARCYGNFVYGHRELSRSEGKSEIEVYAWDMEKNNRSSRQITVYHVMDTSDGPRKLTNQTDIDNKIANVASKQMRGRILALMPKHMIAAGIAAAKNTLAGGGEKPISERLVAMSAAFSKFGVNTEMLEAYLGHPVDNTTVDELADLMGVYNAIKDGAKASDYFNQKDEKADGPTENAAALSNLAKQNKSGENATPPTTRPPRRNSAQNESNVVKDSAPESGHKPAASETESQQPAETKAQPAKKEEPNQEPAKEPPAPKAQQTTTEAPPPNGVADDDVF